MFEWEESTFLGLKSLYRRFVTKPEQQEIEPCSSGRKARFSA